MKVVNTSGYTFTTLSDLPNLRMRFLQHCSMTGIKGTILIATEGININLSGSREQVDKFYQYLQHYPQLVDIHFKESYSEHPSFQRLRIKIKNEIISMGMPNLDTQVNKNHSIKPHELKQWLDENKDFLLLDTRNDYEYSIGSFREAKTLPINSFRDFPEIIEKALSETDKQKPIVMFCTGGVRCDKALPLMLEKGFKNIFQLEGGILNYFQECGSAHYSGGCFVFDDRVAVDPALQETGTVICKRCQWPVNSVDGTTICLRCVEVETRSN